MSWIGTALTATGIGLSIFGKKPKSSQRSSNNQTYTNAPLDKYTSGYRAAAPYTFSTLDPAAVLMSKKSFAPGEKERLTAMVEQEKKETDYSNAAMDRIAQRQKSGKRLTPEEEDFINTSLDKSFESTRKFGTEDILRMAQSSAGGRGLRTSDSAILEPTLRATRDFELGLGSERASQGLQATMAFASHQQAFDEGMQEFGQNLAFNRWNSRQAYLFGPGAQATAGVSKSYAGTDNIAKTSDYGTMDYLNTGMNFAKGAFDIGPEIGKGISGFMNKFNFGGSSDLSLGRMPMAGGSGAMRSMNSSDIWTRNNPWG